MRPSIDDEKKLIRDSLYHLELIYESKSRDFSLYEMSMVVKYIIREFHYIEVDDVVKKFLNYHHEASLRDMSLIGYLQSFIGNKSISYYS